MSEEISKDPSVIQILTQIHNGELNLEDHPLPKEIRIECVDHLLSYELQPIAMVAHFLKVSEKTIKRDQDEIRTRNAKKLSPEETVKIVGELLSKLTETHTILMRLTKDKNGSVQEKAQAGFYAYKALEGQIATLQKLGYAPTKPVQVEADVHHYKEEDISVDQLKADLAELEKMAEDKGRKDPEIVKLIETAKQQIALAEAKDTVDVLRNNLNRPQGNASEQSQ